LAASPFSARAQNSTDSAAAAPTILRLERRDIEVNGKPASVYGIRQPNGTFGLTTEAGKPFRVRDTILVTPGRRVVVAFDANNPGWWAVHCHLLYHLDAGMFTTIKYV
jgi:FtsP/CotA-like multicopper oxidase with cupredoxin domain